MNVLISRSIDRLAGLDSTSEFLLKLTLLLATAWLLNAALRRVNPRWRVLVWRGCAGSVVILLGLALAGPVISLSVAPSIAQQTPAEPTGIDTRAPAATVILESAQNLQFTPDAFADGSAPSIAGDRTMSPAGQTPIFPASYNPARTDARPWSVAACLWIVWGLGMLIGAMGEWMAIARFAALLRRARPADPLLVAQAKRIAAKMKCAKMFEILITSDLVSPCVVGMWRATILLPGGQKHVIEGEELMAVLAHEIQHLKNSDLIWNCLLRCVARLLWFHPLAWRTRAAHAAACDAVCDAAAANLLGDVAVYCRVLARLALRISAPLPAAGLSMARTSSARRRIAALHRKLYSASLPRLKMTIATLAGLAATGLLGATTLTHAENGAEDKTPAIETKEATGSAGDKNNSASTSAEASVKQQIAGVVQGEHGHPVAGATVQIYSAGVRVGTSPFCPTCYPDCGKRAMTDKSGRFAIGSLDSTLVFRLLVIAEGYRPQFITKVDPLLVENLAAKLVARTMPDDPARVVRGVVFDPAGKPAVGAVVEPFGCRAGSKRWWGSMPGVDPLALTDHDGKFTLVCDEPVFGLDLRVEASGAARRNFELVRADGEAHRLALETGSTVEGRIVRDGRGVPGVAVGVVQADRGTGSFVGTYQIGTDADGRFSFANLPAGEELVVFGLMDSLRAVGTVVSKKFTSAQRASTNLGDLPVSPGYRLRGRIVLADGKLIPAHTRVMIGRPEAWDSIFVEPDEGRFSVSNIPGERIALHASIPGYRLSAKNKSFEPLNGTGVEGVVQRDIDDLIVLYEPGKVDRSDFSDNAKWQILAARHNRLKIQPLCGVNEKLETPADDTAQAATSSPAKNESYTGQALYAQLPKIEIPPPLPALPAADALPNKTIHGVVKDTKGKPIAGALVYLPVKWLPLLKSLTATAVCDEEGRFRLTVPEAWLPKEAIRRMPIVWAYAPGHAIGSVNASAQLFGDKADEPFELTLPTASEISFVVLKPDGSPAVGAEISPEHFKTQQGYSIVPTELAERIRVVTGADGRARMPALSREGTYDAVVRLAGSGKQIFRVDMQPETPAEREFRLRPVGRIEGRIIAEPIALTHGMVVAIDSNDLADRDGMKSATGSAMIQVDEQGRFVIPEIAFGALRVQATCDERLPIRPRLPESKEVVLFEGETLKLDIPLEMCVKVRGLVRAKGTGHPIAGAAISVQYGGWRQGSQATTDEKGFYSTFVLAGDVYAQVISQPQGYVQLGQPWDDRIAIPQDEKEFELPPIELAPAETIKGTLLDQDGKPVADAQINGLVGNRRYGAGKTDEAGAFSMGNVPIEIEIEDFQVWFGDKIMHAAVASKDPLVVRLASEKPK
ncbi:MAG TPA: M56 family metallopeptidase [Pirellulales bacterium]|jgi:beta-lactamase regulating signal transducer with metallopeptidase domain/uncharacterized GH25 family protein